MLGEVLTAIVTPFRSDGAVDFERFRTLARHLVEHGSDGLVVAGTTGESPTLTDEERLELFRVAVDEIGDEAAVVLAGDATEFLSEETMGRVEGVGVPPARELFTKLLDNQVPVYV